MHSQDYVLKYDKFKKIGDEKVSLDFYYELLVSNGESSFIPVNVSGEELNSMTLKRSLYYADFGYDLVTYSEEQRLVKFLFKIMGKIIIVNAPPLIDWTITKESKLINGYRCYKATGTSNSFEGFGGDGINYYTAWFAPEIAINNGPAIYHDLPGVVVYASSNDGAAEYLLTSLEKKPLGSLSPLEHSKGDPMDLADFEVMMKRIISQSRNRQKN
jgi:GLPGLI family protein